MPYLSVCRWATSRSFGDPNLPDEADNHLVKLAIEGNADWAITRNTRDVAGGELKFDSFGVVTPDPWLRQDED